MFKYLLLFFIFSVANSEDASYYTGTYDPVVTYNDNMIMPQCGVQFNITIDQEWVTCETTDGPKNVTMYRYSSDPINFSQPYPGLGIKSACQLQRIWDLQYYCGDYDLFLVFRPSQTDGCIVQYELQKNSTYTSSEPNTAFILCKYPEQATPEVAESIAESEADLENRQAYYPCEESN